MQEIHEIYICFKYSYLSYFWNGRVRDLGVKDDENVVGWEMRPETMLLSMWHCDRGRKYTSCYLTDIITLHLCHGSYYSLQILFKEKKVWIWHYIQQHIWQILKLKTARCITHGYCKFQFSRRETRNVKYLRDTWGTCDMWGIGWGEQTCYALWRVTWAQGRACKMRIPLHYSAICALFNIQMCTVHNAFCMHDACCIL